MRSEKQHKFMYTGNRKCWHPAIDNDCLWRMLQGEKDNSHTILLITNKGRAFIVENVPDLIKTC